MTKTSSYHHGNLRQDLLDAALGLLDEQGVEAIGIRQIAKLCGVAHSAPANHFKNKQELLQAVNEYIVEHLIDHVKTGMELNAQKEQEAIQVFLNLMLEYGLTYPNRYRLVWRSEIPLVDAMEEIYEILTGILNGYASKKGFDVESQAIAVWSLVHGYVALRLDGHLSTGIDDVNGLKRQDAIIQVMLDGIR